MLLPMEALAAPSMETIFLDGKEMWAIEASWAESMSRGGFPGWSISEDGYVLTDEGKFVYPDWGTTSKDYVKDLDSVLPAASAYPIGHEELIHTSDAYTYYSGTLPDSSVDFLISTEVSMKATEGSGILNISPIVITNNDTTNELKICSVSAVAGGGWEIASSESILSDNQISLNYGTHDFSTGADNTLEYVPAGGNKNLQLEGKISTTQKPITSARAANVVLTLEAAETFTFTIRDCTFTAEKYMTWEEFVESKYNNEIYPLSIISSNVCLNNGVADYQIKENYSGNTVNPEDIIIRQDSFYTTSSSPFAGGN